MTGIEWFEKLNKLSTGLFLNIKLIELIGKRVFRVTSAPESNINNVFLTLSFSKLKYNSPKNFLPNSEYLTV